MWILVLIFLLLTLIFFIQSPATENTVWTYWHSPFQPAVVKRCLENWEHVGKCEDIRVLNDFNIYRWVPINVINEINDITKMKAHKADLIRLYLLKTYGGIWMDASVFLTQKLHSWLPKERVFCYKAERFSKDSVTCIENFFIKAPPNHPFIEEWYDKCIEDFKNPNYKKDNEKYRNIIGKNGDYLVPYVSSMKIDLNKYTDIVLESSEQGPYKDTVKYGWNNPDKVCENISYSYKMVKLWNKLRSRIDITKIPLTEHNTKIPKVLIQTYSSKDKIPSKVYENVNKYAKGYEHKVFDDDDCYEFISNHYSLEMANKFKSLKVKAHKADLFRYCYLYKYGGVYMDIKTELIKPISEIFTDENNLYTVLSIQSGSIYNGIIASGPGRSIFLDLINFMMEGSDKPLYLSNCIEFYMLLRESYDENPEAGINDNNLYLFDEVCVNNRNKLRHGGYDKTIKKYDYVKSCHDGFDRYKQCCHIYDKGEPILKSRYSDFPWK